MSEGIAVLRLKATRKKIDDPLPEPRIDYERRLAECSRRVGVHVQETRRDDVNIDRKREAIEHAYGVVREYINSVPSSQQSRYVIGSLVVLNMIASINRAKAELNQRVVLGGRR